MPVEETTVLHITCDNAACPGHPDLDPAVRDGWLFVTSEVYGQQSQAHVYGNASCASIAAGTESGPGSWNIGGNGGNEQ